MPKIRFTGSPNIPHDMADKWGKYIRGSIHEVSNDEADRWLRRGMAEVLTIRQANLILKEEAETKIETPPPESKSELTSNLKEIKETTTTQPTPSVLTTTSETPSSTSSKK